MTQDSGPARNALVSVIHSTGRDAGPCFFPSPGHHQSARRTPARAWTNARVGEEDTMATCEIKNTGGELFSVSSSVVLCITVVPVTVGRCFPTLCVVGLATASQRLDSIAAREVVLKEWRLISTEDQRTGASRLLIPLRTIYNVASVISHERLTELTRIFLTLRFLGCVDRSNRHEIASVRLTYIHEASGIAEEDSKAASLARERGGGQRDERNADVSVEVICCDADGDYRAEREERSPSSSPPPPRRASTMPRPAATATPPEDGELFDDDLTDSEEDSRDARLGAGVVIEVSEGEEGEGEEGRGGTLSRGKAGSVPVPKSPLFCAASADTAATPLSESHRPAPLPLEQWVSHLDNDADGFVTAGSNPQEGGTRPREHSRTSAIPSRFSNHHRPHNEGRRGEDVLARATALLGLSSQALWERASTLSRSASRAPSRCGSVNTSQNPTSHPTTADVSHDRQHQPKQQQQQQQQQRPSSSVGTQTDGSERSVDRGAQTDSDPAAQPPFPTRSLGGEHRAPLPSWQPATTTTTTTADEGWAKGAAPHRLQPYLSAPQGNVPRAGFARRTFERHVDPVPLLPPDGQQRLWRTRLDSVSASGVSSSAATEESSFRSSSSRFVPAMKLRRGHHPVAEGTSAGSSAMGNHISGRESGWRQRRDDSKEAAAQRTSQPLRDITALSNEAGRRGEAKGDTKGRRTEQAPSPTDLITAAPAEVAPSPAAATHHRALFPAQQLPALLEDTPLGRDDAVPPSWTFTPVADRLRRRMDARLALEQDQKRLLALRDKSPHTPPALRGVKDTYWILTEPRPTTEPKERGATPVGEDADSGTPPPPQLPPPPQVLARTPQLSGGDDGVVARAKKGSVDGPRGEKRSRKGKGTSDSSWAPRPERSLGTVAAPPPLPLQESPAKGGRRPLTTAADTSGGAVCGSFYVRKHHASRASTGRRLLGLQRGVALARTPTEEPQTTTTIVSLKKLGRGGASSTGGGERAPVLPWSAISGSSKTAENGTGECRVGIDAGSDLEVLSGLLAFTSGHIHQRKVRHPECCLVLLCDKQLVAAVEMESEEDVRMAKSILSASSIA